MEIEWSETRDKRTLGWEHEGPQVWRVGHWGCAAHCTAYCVSCVYCVPRLLPVPLPSSHTTCLRKVYVRTYETTSCVSGLPSSKEPSPGHSLPGTGPGGGRKRGNGIPRRGIDRSTRGKDCERGKSTRVSCGNRPITSGHLLLCLLGTYLFFQYGRAESIRHGHGL